MLGCVYIYYCGGTAEPVAHNNPNPANWMTWHSSFFPPSHPPSPQIHFLQFLIWQSTVYILFSEKRITKREKIDLWGTTPTY